MVLNGTVQQVYAELLKLNPHYDADFEALGSGQEVPKDHLARNPPDSVHCGAEGTGRFSASVGPIREGISYLRRVGGQPVMGPGPGNCGSVSCSYDSGIYWCNDVCSFLLPSPSTTRSSMRTNCCLTCRTRSPRLCLALATLLMGPKKFSISVHGWGTLLARSSLIPHMIGKLRLDMIGAEPGVRQSLSSLYCRVTKANGYFCLQKASSFSSCIRAHSNFTEP